MVKVIMGKKGTGKTKYMIEQVNLAVKDEPGNLVFLSKGNRLMYDLEHDVRYINTQEFDIEDYSVFYGFLGGIIANNYDISHIFIDSIWNIVDSEEKDFESFLNKLVALAKQYNIKFTITITEDKENAPAYLNEYLVKF